MNTQDPSQTESEREIFSEALAKATPKERAAFLDGACGKNARLRSRVDELLHNHMASDSFMADPAVDMDMATLLAPTPLSEGPGTKIGRYKLLQQIGEGGMGVVYMAEQEEPVRRRVALKIIKLGMDTRQVVARFEAERQALAMMDHPNIARVLDGGATETGRPYFVMELVQGVPITDFCDKAKLSAKERLKLFMQVCQAIQSAHQKGIIHRDIKPSNVLVTLHHGEPMPKVIDFGIAKATNQKLTEKTLFTNYASMIGTPAYMSPEQAEMSSMDVDTRADIYSLGVLLYELLTGSTPFPEKRLRSLGYGEMQRVIIEEEPERPRTRLSTMANEQKTAVARNRGEELASLSNLLKGDLDWVVMKCLEKDRTRRYETANGLAADIRRHLGNEPVVARPPSAAYRFQKMVRRNKGAALATASVALVVVLGLITTTWQAIRAKKAEFASQAEATRATRQAARASEAERNAREKSLVAERERMAAEASLYAAHMNLAQTELASGNVGVATDLLNQHRPRPDRRDLRGWEWRYLWQQCRSGELFTLGTHQEIVTGIAISPNGKLLATADVSESGEAIGSRVLLWDFQSRKLLSPPLAEDAAGSVAFSPDGRLVAFGTLQDQVRILNVLTRIEVAKFPGKHRLEINNALAFSPDGKLLAIGDTAHNLRVFEVETGKERVTLVGHQGAVKTLAFFPDGTKLVSGSDDTTVRLWETATGHLITTWTNHTGGVLGVAVSADGQRIVSISHDGTIRLRNVATGAELIGMIPNVFWYSSIAFSSDGKTFACGGTDHSVHIWDAATAKEIRSLRGSRDEVWTVAYTPDGRKLVTGAKDGTVKVWSTEASQPEINFLPESADRQDSVLSPNGKWMLELGTNRICRVVEVPSLQQVAQWPVPESITNVVQLGISPDGTKGVCGTESGSVVVLNALNGRLLKILNIGSSRVESIRFSRNGQVLATCDATRAVVWDANSFLEFGGSQREPSSYGNYSGLNLSDDGKRMAVRCLNGRIAFFRDFSQRAPEIWKAHRGRISEATFFPDDQTMATAGADGHLKLWNLTTKQETLIGRSLNSCSSAALNSSASRIATGAGEGLIRIYDPLRGHQLLTLRSDTAFTAKLRFLDDDKTLVSLGSGGLQVWRAPSWAEIEMAEKAQVKTP